MTFLPHVASRVLGMPLLLGQAKLKAILSVLGLHIGKEPPAASAKARRSYGDCLRPDRSSIRSSP